MPDDHGGLRRRLRDERRAVDPVEAAERARSGADRMTSLPWWAHAASVAVTRPFDGELDASGVAERARARGAVVHVPVLDGDVLRFTPVDTATTWAVNRYGIDEPVGAISVAADEVDLVVVPAVAVDGAGNRLGMGAGWYDRTFSWLGATPRPASTVLVAFVHDEQVVDHLEPAPWDVRVDAIVTPTRVLFASPESSGN